MKRTGAPPRAGRGRRRRLRARRHLDAVVEHWLGYARPPAARVIAASGWRPDPREGYCGRCGATAGTGEVTPGGCGRCRRGPATGDGVVRLGPHAGPLRRWVLAVKFERWADLGARLGRVLGRRVLAAGLVAPERAVVVPMPMPWPRRWHRGIDHAGTIAEGVGAVLGAPCVPVLRRAHGSPPQVTLAPARRRRLGGRGLAVRRPARGWGLRALDLVVVDDVLTTGASVRAAVRRLRRLGPRRVVVAVLAVSDETARRQREAPVTTPSSDFRQFDGRAY